MYVEGRIIAKLKPGITRDDIIKIIPSAELQDIAGGFVAITFEDLPVIDEVQALKDSGLVEHAQPDNIYELTLEPYVPNDNQFANQWALNNSGSNGGVDGVAGEDIDAPMAWALLLGNAYSVGSPGCKVAVIDTGCQHSHPDLSQNVAFADGIDFFNGDYDSLDDNGHGTHVTGIIAAKGDNGSGIAGVAWNCRVYSIKVLGASMQTTDTLLLYAIDHIDSIQAKIVNLSLASHSYSQALYNAMNAKTDVLFVCGAGNSGTDNDTDPWFPASFDIPNVISVANTNHRGELNAYSNYGATSVDVAAPGSNCLSTYPTDDYVWLSGTSMATPYVTGLAVLLKSVSPTLTPTQMKTLIMSTGEALPALEGKTVSGKRINAYNALSQLLSPPPIPTKMIKQSGITDVPDDDKLYCRQNGIWVQKTDDYALPIATITTLGGVIIGANLRINEAGVLSGDAEPYVLLPATETTLGGVKKGSNITISEDGTISATSPDSNNLGYYADEAALTSAHPTANPGNYAFNYDTNTIWVWDADLVDWKDTFRKSFSVEPLEPTKDCLMQWHDSNGNYAKSATTNAYVQNGLFVKIPHSSGKGLYKIKTYGDIFTESYGGIVDLNPYCNAFYNDWPGLGFVCNMIDGVNNSRFGGGLLICGHDYVEYVDIAGGQHGVRTPRVAIAIKPAGGGVMEALYITKDGVVHCDYGIAMASVNIAAGQTYNINGIPHAHSQYLPLTGGNLSGSISLGLNRITNVANPVDGKDAVNVDYISGIVAGIIWQLPVDSITTTTPGFPIEGERHIVGAGATGVFATHDMQIATYTEGVWEFQVASAGWSVSNKADNFAYNYNGTAWAQMPGAVTHGALSGLGGDDHSHYVHKDVARTITAQHSFTHSGAPFLVTSNALVNNLNSKYLDGAVKTDFAATIHQHSISDITSVLITNVLDGQILKYDSVSGKFINVEDIGALAINPNHQFADETERDAYFAAFPSELEDGTLISLGDGFQMYDGEPDPYNIALWKTKTAVVKGPPGINGTDGVDGANGLDGAQGIQGLQGPQGVAGAQGPAGSPGTSINLKGSVATEADLAEIENPTLNDGYYCEADGDCYIWSGTAWVDCGPIVGPTGPQGIQGIQGVAGANGSQGPIGLTGPAGPKGDQGSIGPRGPSSFVNPYYQRAVEGMVPEPPAVFDEGDRFIVSGTPTPLGPWDGHANDIATAIEGEEGLVWFFDIPFVGWAVYDLGSVVHRAWNGSEWKRWESTSGVWGGITGNISEQEDLINILNTTVSTQSVGAANGVCPLNTSSKIDETYLPSYVDDVVEYANLAAFPASGETGKIYVALDTNFIYRWSGSAYIQVGGSNYILPTASPIVLGGIKIGDGLDIDANGVVTVTGGGVQPDWNQTDNSQLDYIKNKPTIPPAYTLPVATGSILGGVKQGTGVSIDVDGTLSITPQPVWLSIGNYTATPASISTITTTSDLTSVIRSGMGMKYQIEGVYYYGIVTAVTSNLVTIAGAPLSGSITALYVCEPSRTIHADFFVNGVFNSAARSDLLAFIMKTKFRWSVSDARLVQISHTCNADDSGGTQPAVNLIINGNPVCTANANAGLRTLSTAWVTTGVDINPANYAISIGDSVEIAADIGGIGNAECLTVTAVFILI